MPITATEGLSDLPQAIGIVEKGISAYNTLETTPKHGVDYAVALGFSTTSPVYTLAASIDAGESAHEALSGPGPHPATAWAKAFGATDDGLAMSIATLIDKLEAQAKD